MWKRREKHIIKKRKILETLEVASYLHSLDNLLRNKQQFQIYWSYHPLKEIEDTL